MTKRASSGVLWVGIILIGLGALFLANNFWNVSAWRILAHYWPVILILIGVRKLYAYFAWKEILPPPDPAGKE